MVRVPEFWNIFSFFSVLPSLFDFTSDGLLAWEYIFGHNYYDETYDRKHVPPKCQLLASPNKTSSSIVFFCEIEPRPILGVITLIIPFLPGIQWYTSVSTKKHTKKIWKFITSLLFPIFMVVFKVIEDLIFKNTTFLLQIGHLFIQGSHTKELMILVTTCETINESMVQLIFQLIIIMTGDAKNRITTYQIMVVSFSFFMASKGPAEDYWAARMKREKKEAEETLDMNKPEIQNIEVANASRNSGDESISVAENNESGSEEAQGEDCVRSDNEKVELKHYHDLDFLSEQVPRIGELVFIYD